MDKEINKKIDYLVSESLDSKVKILGLTALLMDKGIITEQEIESSYEKVRGTFRELAKEMTDNQKSE